jgi:hypothetical protein
MGRHASATLDRRRDDDQGEDHGNHHKRFSGKSFIACRHAV